jgi:hypothetical protein
MREFLTRLIMNYLLDFFFKTTLLLKPEIDIIWLISFPCELFNQLTMVQSHAGSTFHTIFSLSIRVFPSCLPRLSAYLVAFTTRSGGLDFHQVVPNLVLKTMGIMCRVHRAFKAFHDSE